MTLMSPNKWTFSPPESTFGDPEKIQSQIQSHFRSCAQKTSRCGCIFFAQKCSHNPTTFGFPTWKTSKGDCILKMCTFPEKLFWRRWRSLDRRIRSPQVVGSKGSVKMALMSPTKWTFSLPRIRFCDWEEGGKGLEKDGLVDLRTSRLLGQTISPT